MHCAPKTSKGLEDGPHASIALHRVMSAVNYQNHAKYMFSGRVCVCPLNLHRITQCTRWCLSITQLVHRDRGALLYGVETFLIIKKAWPCPLDVHCAAELTPPPVQQLGHS
jgi:hypothetical protein